MNDDYRVNLEVFEGPLDLLMHLIRKNDLDVYDIPVAFVLEEYMSYIDTLRELDIDLAGEFLLMAAELAHIKSRLLLPEGEAEGEEEEADPRADLVRRLLEYQRYKQASEQILERAMLGRDVFTPMAPERVICESQGPVEGDIYELVEAFSRMLRKVPEQEYHDIAVDRISVNDRIYQIVGMLRKGATTSIEELLPEPIGRYDVVITFIALLEMARLRMIRVYQQSVCGPIHIQGTMEEVSDEDVLKLVENEATGFDRPDSGEGARATDDDGSNGRQDG
ncbi:MAG: segregation/condensation protein A [Proteobacteria bacterium]|nr:segregation/condensation protein A [Pseudomonadota bacterium]